VSESGSATLRCGAICGAIDALAIRGVSIAATAARSAAEAATGVVSAPSASRNRRIARACSCDTRDSFTPSSAPMSFIVTSL
jgi:hypothetical protein